MSVSEREPLNNITKSILNQNTKKQRKYEKQAKNIFSELVKQMLQ